MVHFELIKVTIDALSFAEVIINVVIRYNGLLDLIVIDLGLLFILKFWLSLYYFLGIKRRLLIVFYL